jgi:hypothetical protein
MYQITITKPDDESKLNIECRNFKEIVTSMNKLLFSSIDVVKLSSIYTLISKPERVPNLPYKNLLIIQENDRQIYPVKSATGD